jgi:hypothetical protein
MKSLYRRQGTEPNKSALFFHKDEVREIAEKDWEKMTYEISKGTRNQCRSAL